MSHHWLEPTDESREFISKLAELDSENQRHEMIGTFPHGKIGPRDRGQFKYEVRANTDAQIVRVDFGGPVTAIGLTLSEVDEMIDALTKAVWELRGVRAD